MNNKINIYVFISLSDGDKDINIKGTLLFIYSVKNFSHYCLVQ